MADLITTLGNRDRILIDDYAVAPDTTFSSAKILDLIKTFDSAVRCALPLTEPIGSEGNYDSSMLTILTGEIGERVLVTAENGLGSVTACAGNVYTIKTVYLCTWETLTGKPFETLSNADFTVDNGALKYVDKWTAPITDVDDRKQEKVPVSGAAGTGRYAGKRDPVSGESVWEELDEFSLVNSVNGVFPANMPAGKNVQIDASNMNVDDSLASPVTVKDALLGLADFSLTTGILPREHGGTGDTKGRAYLPPGIMVHSAAANPAAQRLLPLEGQTIDISESSEYYELGNAVSKGNGTGVFYKNGDSMLLPDYRGLFLRGSGSQTFSDYGFSGTHNGGNIGDKHGDAIRQISGNHGGHDANTVATSGAFSNTYGANAGGGTGSGWVADFYASRVVPVDAVNHPAFGVGRICISY
jgi:hypothetical protein